MFQTIEITDEELSALMLAMKNRYGLDFTNYEKTSLKRGVSRLMKKHKMESLLELWGKILTDKSFFMQAIDDLLVNLTELFRNPDVWFQIRDNILDKIPDRPLKIWHAGCSTGEEVYTMALVLEEKNLLRNNYTIATDLSSKAIEAAKKGDYSNMLLAQYLKPFLSFYPNRKLEDFFEYKRKHATIKPHYTRHITFQKHNLVHDGPIGSFDLVFCRNVMIYFDEKLKQTVLELLYNSLKPGRFLILGYYDMMPEYGKKLFHLVDIKTRIYQKL
jgi:chemotaxis protein methyltransferase CheR